MNEKNERSVVMRLFFFSEWGNFGDHNFVISFLKQPQ
jgi:hypothetical protein